MSKMICPRCGVLFTYIRDDRVPEPPSEPLCLTCNTTLWNRYARAAQTVKNPEKSGTKVDRESER